MRGWRGVGASTVALGFAVAGCSSGGGAVIDASRLERSIIESTEQALEGATISRAECPDDRAVKAGDEFTCTLVIDGQDVVFRVVQDNDGDPDFDVDGNVLAQDITQYERAAAAFVLQNEGVDVAADCRGDDGHRWLFVSGRTDLDCMVDYGDLRRGVRVGVARNGKVRHVAFTEARLDLGVVTARVSQQLIGALGGPFVLACPDTFADETVATALPPGATFECTAVRNLGSVGTVRVEVVDVNGRLRAEVA